MRIRNSTPPGIRVDSQLVNDWWGQITVKLDSGQAIDWNAGTGELNIEQFNVSASADRVGDIQGSSFTLDIRSIHFEGPPANANQPDMIYFTGDANVSTGQFRAENLSHGYIYQLDGAGNKRLPVPEGPPPSNNVVNLLSDPTSALQYDGPVSDIDNSANATTERAVSLADLRYADGVGSHNNPEVIDLAGTNQALTASGKSKPVYVVQVENTGGSSAELQGVNGISKPGALLVLVTADVNSDIVIPHNAAVAGDFNTADGTNITLTTFEQSLQFVWDRSRWREFGKDT